MHYFKIVITVIFLINAISTLAQQQNEGAALNRYPPAKKDSLMHLYDSINAIYQNSNNLKDNDEAKRDLHQLVIAASMVEFISEKKADAELMERFNTVNRTLKNYQVIMFPKYRQAFADYIGVLVKNKGCVVSLIGTNDRTLLVKGKYFSSEKNRQEFSKETDMIMLKFRFSVLSFKWDNSPYSNIRYNIPTVGDDHLFSIWERY